jgi:hypothetical protein
MSSSRWQPGGVKHEPDQAKGLGVVGRGGGRIRSYDLAGLAAVTFVVLHSPTGGEIIVNPAAVTSMRGGEKSGHFAAGLHCLINTSDGKFVTVVETCETVRGLFDQAK